MTTGLELKIDRTTIAHRHGFGAGNTLIGAMPWDRRETTMTINGPEHGSERKVVIGHGRGIWHLSGLEGESPVTGSVNWREDAACLHADPDLFFPISMSRRTLDQIGEAKRTCRICPVKEPCLAWALRVRDVAGIWGGTTETERRALRRATPLRMPDVARMGGRRTIPTGPMS